MIEAVLRRALRTVFGGGSDIDASNPMPVDITPSVKTATQILTVASLAAGATTVVGDCTAIDLRGQPFSLALTIEATYNAAATLGIRIHVRSSYNNTDWDTEDYDWWDPNFGAGDTIRQTENYDVCPMYLVVLIENLDPAQAVTDLAVVASVGGT